MPYANIVFVKLEKRLANDHRWYMMSEDAQLNYLKLMMLAAETYNRIPKTLASLKMAFRTTQDEVKIAATLEEIKSNFPKFKERNSFYYFEGFDEKTNYIPHGTLREIPRMSEGNPADVRGKRLSSSYSSSSSSSSSVAVANRGVVKRGGEPDAPRFDAGAAFESVWSGYPSKTGSKAAEKHFRSSVKNPEDLADVKTALANYLKSSRVAGGYVQNGSTWFNNWRDWVEPPVEHKPRSGGGYGAGFSTTVGGQNIKGDPEYSRRIREAEEREMKRVRAEAAQEREEAEMAEQEGRPRVEPDAGELDKDAMAWCSPALTAARRTGSKSPFANVDKR